MTTSALIRFTLLAAIWGASFLFMRILSPIVGSFWTAESRLLIGGAALLLFTTFKKTPLELQHWRHYVVVALLNAALPLTLFCIAARALPAGYSAVINSSVPMWTTIFSAYFFQERITPPKILALFLGVCGVALVMKPTAHIPLSFEVIAGLIACTCASISYALNSMYMKKRAPFLQPQATTTLSHLFGAIMVLPFALLMPHPEVLASQIDARVILSALMLGVFCSGIAFLMYYNLMREIGVLRISTVTFVAPLFAIFWGWVVLKETLGWNVFMGAALIMSGAILLFRSNSATTQPKAAQ